ncbi:GNAT family N-acetyltransferase [Microbacterium saperdae]|uniref:Acetyltransferase (GNAT) family protein n=1 Tax=Microbacterium saperdae TaxID=69368 RepID=A0A543BMR9_9MICO|nr:GNAT family N-acetyltransferase [Microbacterium saperdae]TQL86137.1 acetyltransferase (GNAT) family protein [Microbacterium saperdae]GGM50349.1 hypothetical protein GCM10010489_22260 [Microbacterium saperdae]
MSEGVFIREADMTGPDAAIVGDLVGTYLRQTEEEKAQRGYGTSAADPLPDRYRREVEEPASAYRGHRVYLAEVDGRAAGVVIVHEVDGKTEIKRLWTDPGARGRGVGGALLDAAIASADRPVRLSVWEWRAPAVGLYESRGFVRVDSWDERPGLVCMVRSDGALG